MRYVVTRTFLALGFVYELYENLALREFLTSGLKSEKTEWEMALHYFTDHATTDVSGEGVLSPSRWRVTPPVPPSAPAKLMPASQPRYRSDTSRRGVAASEPGRWGRACSPECSQIGSSPDGRVAQALHWEETGSTASTRSDGAAVCRRAEPMPRPRACRCNCA